MWEAIGNVFTSPGGWQVLLTIVVIILMIIFMAKSGMLKVHTRFISVGESYDAGKKINQIVIRRQIEFAEAFCTNLLADIYQLYPEQAYGGWKTRCILEQVYDEIVRWISFNHITNDDIYINNKVTIIRALVMKNDPADYFKTKEFEDKIQGWVISMVKQLVTIRTDTYNQVNKKKEGK